MARIPEAELARLKQEVSLQRLVEAKGVTLSRHGGADLIGLCPFHNDTSPSLVVSPDKNLWHCLGACQTGGSVIDWVMKAEGVSFRHAIELLRADAPSLAASGGRLVKQSTVRKLAPVLTHDADDQASLRQVVDYYHATLKESPEALAYLDKRGLRSPDVVDHFKLGFSNRTLGYRLPQANRAAGTELRGRLQKLGILRETGHEHFRGSLVIPIFDDQCRVVQMYGRKIRDDLREGTPQHLYLPGPHRGVWNIEALKATDEIILCEALIDALTFWCAGLRNVTSAYGINGFTDEHLAAFKRLETKRVLIAYDADDAGNRAAEALGSRLLDEGLECARVRFPRGMDANEYALNVQPPEKSLRVAIEGAETLGKRATRAVVPFVLPALPPVAPLAAKETTATTTPALAETVPPAPIESPAPDSAPARAGTTDDLQDEVTLDHGDRRWRIRGLLKNTSHEVLRVNVLCSRGEAFHVDTLDMYSARQRAAFLKQASAELALDEAALKRDLGKVLLRLEELQDAHIKRTLEERDATPAMTDADKDAALDLLQDPRLLERIVQDFERCGVVGEETNKLTGYLAAVSRKLDEPLAVIIQSSSAAGKSALMEAVLAFVPDEDCTEYSAMTGQSLFYMGSKDLRHKVLAVVEEAGAERAAYALKLLQSEGELTIASTGKDPATGKLITHEYRVEGPVMIFLTTTAIEIDEELLNRCLVLTVDENREQTRAIHQKQRESQTLDGLLRRKDRGRVLAVHQNAQRLLRPLLVANPFATRLTFLDAKTRTRRDHMKYLTLIRTIALVHQFQRPVRTAMLNGEAVEYIDVTRADIAAANTLAHEVLGRSLDELPPQTRRLLTLLDGIVREACERLKLERCEYRFTRREVRERTALSYEQVRVHLDRLVELEYVLAHKGSRGQSFEYELVFDGASDEAGPHLSGLIDVAALDDGTISTLGGQRPGFGVPNRPHTGPYRGLTGVPESTVTPLNNKRINHQPVNRPENALLGEGASAGSYVVAGA